MTTIPLDRSYHQAALATMTDEALVAYWNVLQMERRMLVVHDEASRWKAVNHPAIVADILAARGIPCVDGKQIARAA